MIVEPKTPDPAPNNTTAEAKTLAGFNNLEFSQQIIKGDNSTIINIYYDRIIYNVSLNVSNDILNVFGSLQDFVQVHLWTSSVND